MLQPLSGEDFFLKITNAQAKETYAKFKYVKIKNYCLINTP